MQVSKTRLKLIKYLTDRAIQTVIQIRCIMFTVGRIAVLFVFFYIVFFYVIDGDGGSRNGEGGVRLFVGRNAREIHWSRGC